MNLIKYLAAGLLTVVLAACGGGGGSAGSVIGGTTTTTGGSTSGTTTTTSTVTASVTPASVELLASSNTLQSATGTVVITALVKNGLNNGMAGQSVTFSASSGVLQGAAAATDSNGVATANLITGANKALRVVAVTVSSGSVSSIINVPVVGTSVGINGEGSLLLGNANKQYDLRALDSSGNAIAGATLTVSSSLGNGLSTTTLTTDGIGKASFLYTANNAGIDTLNVSGLGTSAQLSVLVSGEDFSFQSPSVGTQIPISSNQTVTVRYRSGGVGVAGQVVTFSTTRGTVGASTVLTDASGLASTTVSSNTSGPATVNASIAGVAQSGLAVEFLATTPSTLVLQANPNAVQPNASGTTTNQSVLLATVRDASGNPVKNVNVSFAATDPSGGSISPGTGVTDSNGSVQASFIAGANPTANNGVILQAKVTSTPSIFGTTSLTVSGKALFIAIGTSNEIGNLAGSNGTQYEKPFSVYVTDANGAPVVNQPLVLSIYANIYKKGGLSWDGTTWNYTPGSPTICPNEDVNADGILQLGEDTNGNGVLTPGGVISISPGNVLTNSNGFATFSVVYGEQYAPWIEATIKASATVAGTESSSSSYYFAGGSAADFGSQSVAPAGVVSPFGVATSCTDKN